MSDIVVLAALRDELDEARAPDGVRVIHTGVGKVNAASVTMAALLSYKPALVINYGTAGKLLPALTGLVEVSRVIQRDMMAMPLAPRGTTPLTDGPHEHVSSSGNVVCGTGDSFVTASDPWLTDNGVHIVDMELFAIAHVCHRHGTPWRAFKFITDDANDGAATDWSANFRHGQDLFWEAIRREGLGG
jgi:adenosylhomocysteine nucleosidase